MMLNENEKIDREAKQKIRLLVHRLLEEIFVRDVRNDQRMGQKLIFTGEFHATFDFS